MFALDPAATREERRAVIQAEKQAKFEEHYESLIDRAPDLAFLKSRAKTDKLRNRKLRDIHATLWKRHLTDPEVNLAQKIHQELMAGPSCLGSAPAPSGLTTVTGVVTDVFRVGDGIRQHNEAGRPLIHVRDDQGFVVKTTCPVFFITGAPAIGIEGPGSLHNLLGWRVSFKADLVPWDQDHTVAVKRHMEDGGNGYLAETKLLGKQFEYEVGNEESAASCSCFSHRGYGVGCSICSP